MANMHQGYAYQIANLVVFKKNLQSKYNLVS
jgi:hypothetical protein